MAHFAARIVCLAAVGGVLGIATLIGAKDPAASSMLKRVAVALAIMAEVVFVLTFAYLRGAVLRQALPNFPMTLWVGAVASYTFAMYLMSGISSAAVSAPPAAPFTSTALAHGILLTLLIGTVFGALIGTIEALVIRRAARGALLWAICVALGYGIGRAAAFAISVAAVSSPKPSAAAMLAIGAGMKFGIDFVFAAMTLAALKGLRPRRT